MALLALLLAPPAPAQDAHLLIVAGIGGEQEYSDSFHKWASALQSAAETKGGLARAHITYLGEKPEREPGRIAARSTRENVEQALHKIVQQARPGDTVTIVLFGHGSALSGESRFSLPGPDMSAADFARLLQPLSAQRIVFVNASSASGDFQKPLQGPNRIVITATKSGMERNESVFGEHFAAAFASDGADADKNGSVSFLEAFEYAQRQVAEVYQKSNRLQTEHAVLEDGQKGALARATFLRGDSQAADASEGGDPRVLALEKERRALEDKVGLLKARKDALTAEAYEKELERLLLELAEKSEAIRAAKGGK
jgi:plasmid stabilization system protein ParE